MTRTNLMPIARDWSSFCGTDYMLYVELLEWLTKNHIIHHDTESGVIAREILQTIRQFEPDGTMPHQDVGRVK